MTKREEELTEELEALKRKYCKLVEDHDKLVRHFVPWVFTHPHMLPEGWKIEQEDFDKEEGRMSNDKENP